MFRKKNKFQLSHESLIVLTVIALITFFAILASNISDSRMSSTKIHTIGEIISPSRDYTLVVDQATFNNDLASKMHLPGDKKVLVIHLQISNNSDKKLDFMPVIHTFMRNDRGESYEFTPGVTGDTIEAKMIDPGQKLSGDLAFIVEAEYMPLWFYFDSKFGDEGPVSIKIVK